MTKRVLLASVTILLYALYVFLLFGGLIVVDGDAFMYLLAHPLLLCGFGLLLGALLIYQMYWPHRKPLVLTRQTYEKNKRVSAFLLLVAVRLALVAYFNLTGIFKTGELLVQIITGITCAVSILTLVLLFSHRAFPGMYIGFVVLNISLATFTQAYAMAGEYALLEAAIILYLFLSENVAVFYRTRPVEIIETQETAQPDDEAVGMAAHESDE